MSFISEGIEDSSGADTASQAYRERGMLEKARMAEMKENAAKAKLVPAIHRKRRVDMDWKVWGILFGIGGGSLLIATVIHRKTR